MLHNFDFFSLKKNIKRDFKGLPVYKLAILGDSSTQFLSVAIKGLGYEFNINFDIYESDYNQINQEVFSNSSGLYNFEPDFILIFHSTQKLLAKFQKNDEKDLFAINNINEFEKLIQCLRDNSNAKIIFSNFSEIQDGVFGNFSNQVNSSFTYQLRKLNYELMNLSIRKKNFFINDISSLNNHFGFKNCFDPKLYINGDFVFSLDFTVIVTKNIIDIILSIIGKMKKCLILDLDNTLWGGVIGDDGLENIQIGDLGIGKAFTHLQKWIKQLKQRGIIIAICSKNTEKLAKEPFQKHPDMILKLEDISVFLANWETKVDNIRAIKSILNIGYDSMVFLDDNAFEREFVKRELPEITVPELPVDPSEYLYYLTSLNLFETSSYNLEDSYRNQQYQEEAKRAIVKQSFTSDHDYLASLEMQSSVNSFNKFNIPRVSQLTQRSNQFNVRTIRYSEDDIEKISFNKDYSTLAFTLKDKYGDYGLISAVILKKVVGNLFIDTWVMSCRVLKRGMEQFIFNKIAELAKKQGVEIIIGEYLPTEKNIIVESLYKDLGFELSENLWKFNINNLNKNKFYIHEQE
jgi:FkbH-like protein